MTRRDMMLGSIAAASSAGRGTAQTSQPPKPKITSSVMLWTLKGSFEERVRTAALAGIQSVELVTEYTAWQGPELQAMKKLVQSLDLTMDTLLATPDWTKRPVTMVNPAHRAAFLDDVRRALETAEKLDIPQVILMSGNEQPGMTREQQYASMLDSGKRAAELAEKARKTLIIEPLNSKVDHKGYYLTTCAEGLRLVKEIDSSYFRLLYDLYHEQTQTGDATGILTDAIPFVAVFHVADSPGRHDPGTGKMDYPAIYKAIAKTGYSGYICMEYLPEQDARRSLIKSVDQMRASVA